MAWLVALAALACGGPETVDAPVGFDRSRALRVTGERVIVPALLALSERASALERALSSVCDAPDSARVEAARSAWQDAYLAFERTTAFDFGPARDRNLGLEMAFWPVRTESVEARVAATDEITDAWVDRLGASGEGLFAIEYLLYSPSEPGLVAEGLALSPRRCVYLAALGRHVGRTAHLLAEAWEGEGGHLALLASASWPGNLTYRSLLTAESVMVSHLIESIASVRQGRLARPLGLLDSSPAEPLLCRTRWAHRSVAGMLATLDGARALFTAGGEVAASLEGYVRSRRPELAERVLRELDSARAAVERVPEPLGVSAAESDRALALSAISTLRVLEQSLTADVVGLLGVTLLPFDMDGD